jgi:hypothetical protein
VDVEADPLPKHLDVGVPAKQCVGDCTGELWLVGDEQRDVAQDVDHPGGWVVGVMARGRRGRKPSPEDLRNQMFLRREVRVGRGRADAGFGGHPAHGQPGESLAIEQLECGPAEAVDGVCLLGGQSAPSRLQSRIGHVSGRYYNTA